MISSAEFRRLLSDYRTAFGEVRPFFSHPFSLLVNFPEAHLTIREGEVLAQDGFGKYMPFLYHKVLYEAGFIAGVGLHQLSALPRGRFALVDWEFVYDKSIMRAFRSRRYLINRAKRVGIECVLIEEKRILDFGRQILDVVSSWQAEDRFLGAARITAESMRECVRFTIGNLEDNLLDWQSVLLVLGMREGQIIGFSLFLIDEDWMYDVFEFTYPHWRWAATFLFFSALDIGFERGARWVNTLGSNGLEGLRYNKERYKPKFLIPQYRWERP